MKSRRKTLSISQLDLAEMAEVEILGMEMIFQVRQTVKE